MNRAIVRSERSETDHSQGGVDRRRIDDVRLASFGARGGGLHQAEEERVWSVRTRLELGVRLGSHEKRVTRDLDEFDEASVGRRTRTAHTSRFELVAVARIEFVTMTVTLRD